MRTMLSILLPVYKRRYLGECIDSVLRQNYKDWELIVVNDHSPEDIDAVMAGYEDPRIRYYVNASNYGAKRLVEQWNKCLSLAQGAYVICIGDDDRLRPDCLSTYVRLIEQYPEVQVLHGQTDIIDENGMLIRHTPSRLQRESALGLMYHRDVERMPQFIGDFCYRTDALRAAGGFYSLPYAWGSDDITAIRAATANGIVNTDKVVFEYRDHGASITRHPHVCGKLRAVLLEARWKRRFLRQPASDEQDRAYQQALKKQLLIHTLKKCYNVIRNAY